MLCCLREAIFWAIVGLAWMTEMAHWIADAPWRMLGVRR